MEVVSSVQNIIKEKLAGSMISSMQSLQSHFNRLDTSGDGLLNKEELINSLIQSGESY